MPTYEIFSTFLFIFTQNHLPSFLRRNWEIGVLLGKSGEYRKGIGRRLQCYCTTMSLSLFFFITSVFLFFPLQNRTEKFNRW